MADPATPDPVTEIRALLLQFEKSALKDFYLRTGDWAVFMAQPGGGENPMRRSPAMPQPTTAVQAPHLGLFEPACAPGDRVRAGGLVGMIDVLGRKTEVASASAGRIVAVHFAAGELVEYGQALIEVAVD